MSIGVIIVDDQAIVRSGFQAILTAQPDFVVLGEAADGEAGVQLAAQLQPDVVLMDIRMPRMDGLEAAGRILSSAAKSPPRVIMVTTFEHDEYVFEAVRLGASGFLLKDVSPDGLVEAIRVIHAGNALFAPAATRHLVREFTRSVPRRRPTPGLKDLTPREEQVLRLVAEGLSNAEIARRIHVGESTIKTHVGHLLLKLGLANRIQAVVLAYEAGLVRPGQ